MLKKLLITSLVLQFFLSEFHVYCLNNTTDRKILSKPFTLLPRNTNNIKRIDQPLNKFLPSFTSTVVFEESFEGSTGFPPSGWKTINADGGGTTGPWFQGNTSVFAAYNGIGYAAANYQGANDFLIDEWLITPLLTGINSSDTLSFWNRSPDYSAWDDSIEIRISTTDTNISSFNKVVDYFKTSTTGWAQKKYPLKNFISDGANIYIAFRYLIYDGGVSGLNSDYVGIDLVQILRPQQQYDIQTALIDFSLNNSKILIGNSFEPTVTFQNVGTTTLSNTPVRLKIVSPTGSIFEDSKTINTILPQQSIQIIFNTYTIEQTGKYKLQAFTLLSNDQNRANDTLTISFTGANLLGGTYTVGAGGKFSSIKQAIDTLTENIIGNDVTLTLISSLYNEEPILIGPQSYLSDEKKIIIKPAINVSPTINITPTPLHPYGISIFGASKIIIDGANSPYPQRNLKLNVSGAYGKKGIFIGGTFNSNADSNIIRNLIIRIGADSLNNSGEFIGILLSGYNYNYKDIGNKIINCDISNHGFAGIAAQWQEGMLIEKNYIHDWNQLAGENDVYGILLDDGVTNSIIQKNKIGNLKNYTNYYWAYGIEINSGIGSNNLIANNMIYNILASGNGTLPNITRAIYSSNLSNTGDKYYYNSIYLSGTDNSSSTQSRITGFEFIGGSNIELKNNIVMNETNLPNSSGKAYCIYLSSLPNNFSSNYNNLYTSGTSGAIGFYQSNKITLDEWKDAFTPKQDSLSISVNPFFVSPALGDLHIEITSNSQINNMGIPLALIQDDIDDAARNSQSPDIGADEFTPANKAVNVTYNPSWNLVSVPLLVSDYQKNAVFPTAISNAYSFNGNYISNSILTNGKGYWLKFPQNTTQTIGGDPLPETNVTLTRGWNLIGSIDHTIPIPINQIFDPIIYGYNQGYEIVDSIQPGKAYWLKSYKDTTITLGSTLQHKPFSIKNKIEERFNKIKISNELGYEQVLYFGEPTDEINKPIEMPPIPSEATFDVRFESNNFLEIIDSSIPIQYLPKINIRNDAQSIKICWNILENKNLKYEIIIEDSTKIQNLETENFNCANLNTLLRNIIIKVTFNNANLPDVYRIEQNYPNPFNSNTIIKFQLPDRSKTKISLYNILGQEIYKLIERTLEAGYHQIQIGNNITSSLGSGVYFYQIVATSEISHKTFNDVKKLLLVK